jgi:hypothetical protein
MGYQKRKMNIGIHAEESGIIEVNGYYIVAKEWLKNKFKFSL